MIHLSLPLQPRLSSPAETLFTPLSVFNGSGKRAFLTTALHGDIGIIDQFSAIVRDRIGIFDVHTVDTDPAIVSAMGMYLAALPMKTRNTVVCRCQCGKFEEVAGIRMYNQRRIKESVCTYCNEPLREQEACILTFNPAYSTLAPTCNRPWVEHDFAHFLTRNASVEYKLSKECEPVKYIHHGQSFGIRHQLVWASAIAHLGSLHDDTVTLHFVYRVSDLVFICAALAKQLRPSLDIHLNGLPAVWLPERKSIIDVLPGDMLKMRKGFTTNRKELRV